MAEVKPKQIDNGVTGDMKRRHKLAVIEKKLEKGSVVGVDDFFSIGLHNVDNAVFSLKKKGLDVLTVRRGSLVVGYILAGEIL